jgi:O-antigen/teichoic acid export membrane protein
MMTSQVVTWTLATVAAIVVPRFVDPSIVGDLRLAGSLWMIAATVTALGTSTFLQLEIARSHEDGLALVGPVISVRTVAFAACTVALALYVALTGPNAEFVVVFALIGAATLLTQWSDVLATSFLGLEHMSTPAIANVASKFFNLLLVIIVLRAGAGAIGVTAVGVVTVAGGLAYLIWKLRSVVRIRIRGWSSRAVRIVRGSVIFMAAGIALVIYQQIDVVVISWVAEAEDLGWYATADALFGSLLFPATIVLGAIFPTIGRLHQTDPDAVPALVTRAFSLLLVIALPIGLGTTLIAPEFAPLLFGEDYRPTGVVLAILGPVSVLTFGTTLFGGTALATGRARIWVTVIFVAAAITVPLDIILVPWANDRYDNGAIGGAVTYLVTESMQFVVGVLVIAPFLLTRSIAWRSLRALAAGGVMFAVGWPLRETLFIVPVVVCGVVYVLAILAMRVLGDDEMAMVTNLISKARGVSG